jgi:hypothetical protein
VAGRIGDEYSHGRSSSIRVGVDAVEAGRRIASADRPEIGGPACTHPSGAVRFFATAYREDVPAAKPTDDSLKRLGGGRWQTRDERFTIEPQSGTWVIVDAEQADELGLPLVRGPFGSLRAAKEAITTARETAPPASPLRARAERERRQPRSGTTERPAARARRSRSVTTAAQKAPAEPRWLVDLGPDDRRRARRLIDRLTKAGAPDPEGLARRDLVGDVPAVAAFALLRAIEGLDADAPTARVARLLADGRDDELGVRWRLVDGDGRPITVDLDARE